MPIPKNKDELLKAIEKDYLLLKKDLLLLPEKIVFEKSLDGHKKDTVMSCADLVSYLIGWADQVLVWDKSFREGQKPIFPHSNFKWTELGELAICFYDKYRTDSWPDLLDQFEDRVIALKDLINNSPEDIYETLWYKNYTKGRMIQLNSSSPYKNARKRLRLFLRTEELLL